MAETRPKDIRGYLISESETMSSTPNIVSDKSGSPTIIETVLQEGDVENRNKRIYPTSVIKGGLAGEYVQERLKTQSWFGEAGHPLNPSVERQLYIDQSNISHIIKDIWWKGNLLYGKVETALTARGKDMQGLIRQGSKVAFSLRGFGPICEKKGDITYIKDPLHILTYDFVIHPSHRPAYMTRIIQESAGSFKNDLQEGYFIPLTESAIVNYLKDYSNSVKSLSEQYEFDPKNILGKKNDLVYINDGRDILAVYIEDYINDEINDYLSHM